MMRAPRPRPVGRLRLVNAFALVVASLLVPLTGTATASPAGPVAGKITVQPAGGTDLTPFTMLTSNSCPAGSNVFASIFGAGFPATGRIIVGNSPVAIYEHTALGGVAMPIADTLRDFQNEEVDPKPLAGTYRLQVECRDGAEAADLGDFEGLLTFTSPHAYRATNPTLSAAELNLLPAPGIAHSVSAPSQGPAAVKPTAAGKTAAPHAAAAAADKASRAGSNSPRWLFFGGGGVLVALGLMLLLRGRRGRRGPAVAA